MKAFPIWAFAGVLLPLITLGCTKSVPPQDRAADAEARIQANLEKLDPLDRELALEQKYCAVETKNRLGKMGKPVKLTLKDQPVFLCCEGCEKTARKNVEKTLTAVEKLKSANSSPPSRARSAAE